MSIWILSVDGDKFEFRVEEATVVRTVDKFEVQQLLNKVD